MLFNHAAEAIFGYAAEEILGEAVEILIPDRFHADHRGDVRSFAAGSETARRIMGHRREVLGRRKSGEEFPVEATVSRRPIDGSTTLRVVIRDVSERRRIEHELAARNRELTTSESRLRLALEGGRMGTWEWNLQSIELVGDNAMRQLWGLREAGPLTAKDGTDADDASARIHPDDLPELRRVLDGAIARDGEFASEFRSLAKRAHFAG